jgi:putative CocE/NonD family hydrolase
MNRFAPVDETVEDIADAPWRWPIYRATSTALRAVVLCGLLSPAPGFAQLAGAPPRTVGAIRERDVAVPMRDGTVLRADVLHPAGQGRFPVLVYRTPYGKEVALRDYAIFARAVARGYAVVVEDVRGRFASSGEFRPYQNEGRDGYDTIEWAASQPWSNGAVGTFGLSYPGAAQWLAAVLAPPHLLAIVPAMTFSSPQRFFYSGGIWDLSWIEWIWDDIAPGVRAAAKLAGPKTAEQAEAAWDEHGSAMLAELPLDQLAELRDVAPYYYDWLSHPPDDPWWAWCDLRGRYSRVRAAVLNLSGWYDDFYGPDGATTSFMGLRGSGSARPTHLLLGPWTHGVEETAMSRAGERDFGPSAAIDYDETVLRWMDHALKGLANGVDREAAVRYFVMGENRWREAESWPPRATATSYYLHRAAVGAAVGQLSTRAAVAASALASFVADPARPVTDRYAASGAHDYRALARRADVLTFDSAPLERAMEVTGAVGVQIDVACDCRDVDLWVRLLDLSPDGTAFNLASPGLDVQRASYRELSAGRQPLVPGQIYALAWNNLITSNAFLPGHRLRVQISASLFPAFSRNLQTGESEVTGARTHKATLSIYTDARHPSRIILPVVARH